MFEKIFLLKYVTKMFYICRTTWQPLELEIGADSIKVITKDRRILTLGFQEKEVEDIIKWQVGRLLQCMYISGQF